MATEFTVHLEDRPGSLADLAEALARQGVNIIGIHAAPCPTEGIVQFVTNNNEATVEALQFSDIQYTIREVVVLKLVDEPGALARVSRAFSTAGVNINALYITMTGMIVIDTSDLRAAQKVALDLGIM